VKFTVDPWDIELLGGIEIEAKGLLPTRNINISAGRAAALDAKHSDCGNMDKGRSTFHRLRPSESSNDCSKLINDRDQPEETKDRLEK
jgi:hypothetical protein